MGLFLRLAFFFAFFVPWLASAASVFHTGGVSLDVQTQSPDITYSLGPTLQSGGTHPKGIVVADFDGDGKLDVAVSNFDPNSVAVFLNRGFGIFAAPITAPIITTVRLDSSLGLNVGSLAVGDFNEDGKPDLVVATIAGSQASIVLLGNGDGTFRQQRAEHLDTADGIEPEALRNPFLRQLGEPGGDLLRLIALDEVESTRFG